jgi:acetolactate synthase I/II/III large subunit
MVMQSSPSVDGQLALIELKQRSMQLSELAVQFGLTDFVAVAKGLGGVGEWVDSAQALAAGLEAAWARPTFTLLACPIGPSSYDGLI